MLAKLHKTLAPLKPYGAVFLRAVIGWRLIDGTQDNVFDWQRMLEFRDFLHGHHVLYPLAGAVVSVYAQFLCGILFIAGALTRPAAVVMVINFTAALLIAHVGMSFVDSFDAWMMLAGSLFFFFHGAGKLSVDDRLESKSV